MANWRLLYSGAVSGELLGELPFLSAQHTDTLNGTGSWSAQVPFDQPDIIKVPDGSGGITEIDRTGAVDFTDLGPARTIIYLEREGVILGQGMLWGVDLDYESGVMTLSGSGLGSYYSHRLMNGSTWTSTEQLDIVRALIAAAELYQGIGLEYDLDETGVLRDRTYYYFEGKPVLEAINQLANTQNGFDYRFRAAWEAGQIVRRLHFDYPATGRTTDIVFEVGVNVAILGYSEDGADLANNVRGLGAGEGVDKLIRVAVAVPPSEMPQLDAAISHVDVSNVNTLDNHTQRRLQRGLNPMRRMTLSLVPGTVPNLGAFDVGDRVYVRAAKGWLNVSDYFRIVEIGVSVDQGGEKATVVLAGMEAFE